MSRTRRLKPLLSTLKWQLSSRNRRHSSNIIQSSSSRSFWILSLTTAIRCILVATQPTTVLVMVTILLTLRLTGHQYTPLSTRTLISITSTCSSTSTHSTKPIGRITQGQRWVSSSISSSTSCKAWVTCITSTWLVMENLHNTTIVAGIPEYSNSRSNTTIHKINITKCLCHHLKILYPSMSSVRYLLPVKTLQIR